MLESFHKRKKGWGYKDRETGRVIVAPKYDRCREFYNGRAIVKLDNKYGFIDEAGREICPLKYTGVYEFDKNGYAVVQIGDEKTKRGLIDSSGKEIVPCEYEWVDSFCENRAIVKLNDLRGFVDENGKEICPIKYDCVKDFSEGIAVVVLGGKYGMIDSNGKEIWIGKYDEIRSFKNGYAIVRLENKYGFIDKDFNLAIELKYKSAENFKDGYAKVSYNGQNFYINKEEQSFVKDARSNYLELELNDIENARVNEAETENEDTRVKTTTVGVNVNNLVKDAIENNKLELIFNRYFNGEIPAEFVLGFLASNIEEMVTSGKVLSFGKAMKYKIEAMKRENNKEATEKNLKLDVLKNKIHDIGF